MVTTMETFMSAPDTVTEHDLVYKASPRMQERDRALSLDLFTAFFEPYPIVLEPDAPVVKALHSELRRYTCGYPQVAAAATVLMWDALVNSTPLPKFGTSPEESIPLVVGLGSGLDDRSIPAEKIMRLAEQVKPGQLKKVLELIGRARPALKAAVRKRSVKSEERGSTYTDLSGYANMTSNEYVHTLTPELQEIRALQGNLEAMGQADTRHLGGGDVVLLVDESGSMATNDNITSAKALALAVMAEARSKGRKTRYIGFHGHTREVEGTPTEQALAVMGGRLGFSTDFEQAFKLVREGGQSDVLFITDGDSLFSQKDQELLAEWKRNTDSVVHSIFLPFDGDEGPSEALLVISDTPPVVVTDLMDLAAVKQAAATLAPRDSE